MIRSTTRLGRLWRRKVLPPFTTVTLAAIMIAATLGIPAMPALPFVPVAKAAPTVVNIANAPTTGIISGVIPEISNVINWGPAGSIDWEIQGPAGARYLIPRVASGLNPLGTFTSAGHSLTAVKISNPNPSAAVTVGIRCGAFWHDANIPAGATLDIPLVWAQEMNPSPRCSNFQITNDVPVRIRTLTYDFALPNPVTVGTRYKVNFNHAGVPSDSAILTGTYPADINLLDWGQEKTGGSHWSTWVSSDPARPGLLSLNMVPRDRTFEIKTAKTVLRHIDVFNANLVDDIRLDIYCGAIPTPEVVTVQPWGDRQAELSFGGATACSSIRIVTTDLLATEIDGMEFEVDVPPPPVEPFGNTAVGPDSFQVEAGPVRAKLGFPYTAEWFGPYTRLNIWVDNLSVLQQQSQGGEIHVALYRSDEDNPTDGPPDLIMVNCAIPIPAATAGQWYSCTFGAEATLDPWDRYFLAVWHPMQNNFRPLFRRAGAGSGYGVAWDGPDSTFAFQWGSPANPQTMRGASFYMDAGAAPTPGLALGECRSQGVLEATIGSDWPWYWATQNWNYITPFGTTGQTGSVALQQLLPTGTDQLELRYISAPSGRMSFYAYNNQTFSHLVGIQTFSWNNVGVQGIYGGWAIAWNPANNNVGIDLKDGVRGTYKTELFACRKDPGAPAPTPTPTPTPGCTNMGFYNATLGSDWPPQWITASTNYILPKNFVGGNAGAVRLNGDIPLGTNRIELHWLAGPTPSMQFYHYHNTQYASGAGIPTYSATQTGAHAATYPGWKAAWESGWNQIAINLHNGPRGTYTTRLYACRV